MRRHVRDHELILAMDREMSEGGLARVTQHVATCAQCRDRADRLRTAMADVGSMYLADGGASAGSTEATRSRLASALREAAGADRRWLPHAAGGPAWTAMLRGAAACAAVAVLAVAAVFGIRALTASSPSVLASGEVPQPSLTPGAVTSLTATELCRGERPSRIVTESVRQQVLHAYGMEHVAPAAYELDALITPELGGSTEPANLWPQRYRAPLWTAHVKDELERLLPDLVCANQVTLAQAQREIATDWIGAYKRYFRTDVPLESHRRASEPEEPELIVVADPRIVLPSAVARVGSPATR